MKTTLLDAKRIGKNIGRLISNYDDLYWAVAWGSHGPLARKLLNNKDKISNILIGIDFFQTDPNLLDCFQSVKNARVAVGLSEGTFHPKIYYFQSENKAAAIVGSANFTNAGTQSNIEAALLLEGKVDDPILQDIRSMVETLWLMGSAINNDFITSYRMQYVANKKHRAALEKPLRVNRATKNATHPDLLTKPWSAYVADVTSSLHHDIEGRLDVLRKAQFLLSGVDSFSELDTEQRKSIAGTIAKGESFGNELDEYDWGWFGSMTGAGCFKNRIVENDQHISLAMDCIPPIGEVSKDDYLAFINEFQLAFVESKKQGGISSASRLLTIKRPDYFVCVDQKNIKRLSDDLGFARTTLNFEKYWTEIIEPITQSNWWLARRPRGIEGRIWDGRAAMLDAIYYEPN